ncbi:MAG: hypothetical protein CL388_09555 [Acidiferrobacteraceae bacterium]|jgi:hypothetical protein|nr:hypothetical protein [Acidiferrobacteraceae bacterium]MDP6434772.1 hypothetical protein [Arenicellales bacterium]MDP6671495.1 hypothetical protein [Arenicellales bacterium]MDP6724403.1 hypothetical protein [Arenicellales bacterium]|tara:strand:- start:79008 stop:79409 length:402 start_codon:yes stop_codon:yes gene_type:complete
MRFLTLLLLFTLPLQTVSADSWPEMAEEIVVHIDRSTEFYQAGELKKAAQEVVKAYFGIFEDKKMEAAIRVTVGSKHAWLVERLFGKLRKAIKGEAGLEAVMEAAEKIREAVRRDALVLVEKEIPLEVFQPNQ